MVIYKIFCFVFLQCAGLIILGPDPVKGLKCIECDARNFKNQREPCIKGGLSKTCRPDEIYCFKADRIHADGHRVIGRSCQPAGELTKLKANDCVRLIANDFNGIVCLCDTDNCNSTGHLHGWSFGYLIIIVTLVLIIVQSTQHHSN